MGLRGRAFVGVYSREWSALPTIVLLLHVGVALRHVGAVDRFTHG